MIEESAVRARETLDAWILERDGVRGVACYRWITDVLMRDGRYALIEDGGASCVVVLNNGRAIITALVTEPDYSSEQLGHLIDSIREWSGPVTIGGLALPGDRVTKNIFEALGMPAQILAH